MAIVYSREVIATKNGTVATIRATGVNYKKDSTWFYDRGFRYFGKHYLVKAGVDAEPYFGIKEDVLATKFPKAYASIVSKIDSASVVSEPEVAAYTATPEVREERTRSVDAALDQLVSYCKDNGLLDMLLEKTYNAF